MTYADKARAHFREVAIERGLRSEGEARSYIVKAGDEALARYEARGVAKEQSHPNPYHGTILWIENLGENRWEVVIATTGGAS